MEASVFDGDEQLDGVLRQVACQLKQTLGNVHGALEQLAPPDRRDEDSQLDREAAALCRSYFRMLRLADNLAAAADMGAAALPLGNDDIVAECREIMERVEHLADMLGLEVAFHCQKSSHIIAMDVPGIERLLLNLLSNAFKYTPGGGRVSLEVCIAPEQVELRLSDTGCGIPPERLEHLFDRCFHLSEVTPPPHGLGLGLPLCQAIAEKHGGRLLAESVEGKGSRFTISLPDQQSGKQVSDILSAYHGGFNRTLMGLSDALPTSAYSVRNLD